jgi:glycosyltransferase involved in cell wall biosynthesis
VLFLSCHSPYPPVSGGRLREHELLARLGNELELQLCVVSKAYYEDRRAARSVQPYCASIDVFPAAGTAGCQVARHACPAATAYVEGLLRRDEVDLVHAEGFYMTQHIPELCDVPVVLVEQNVEYELWRQRVETAGDAATRRSLFLAYRQTRELELAAWRKASVCAAVTEDDRRAMRRALPGLDVRLIPDGADHVPLRRHEPAPEPETAPTIVLVGNYAYQPNVDAAVHLCRDILPSVLDRVPNAHVFLVGNAPDAEVRALAGAHVTVTGRVVSVTAYLDRADVVVLPLRVGVGVKVKMLEALRRGKAIVTSPVGLQGLAGAETCVLVADDAPTFAAATVDVLKRPDERKRLEQAALAFAAGLPTWDDAANALAATYRAVSTGGRRRRRSANTRARTGSRS